jgi:hypothetical protein
MGMHTDLPIHKAAFDLLSMATDITRNIPRDFKAGLGAKVRDECIEVMVLIARANAEKDKRPHLGSLVERIQVIEFLLRLFKEKRFISIPQHAAAILVTTSIGKQANAWNRSTATAPAT